MPYEDEEIPHWEPEPELNALSSAVIGAAIEVHKRLGPGLDEDSYQKALEIEFRLREIPFMPQVLVEIEYKGEIVGKRRLDFIVDNRIVVEIKSVEQIIELHKAQVYTYLKITNLRLGLLINFNVLALKDGIRRVIRG